MKIFNNQKPFQLLSPALSPLFFSERQVVPYNHQRKQSLVSWGFASHVFSPPRTTSCTSPPTPLWFIFPFPAIPPFPTSGPHIWKSERQLACGFFQALHLLTDAPDRQRWGSPCRHSSWEDVDGGVSSLLSHHFNKKKEKKKGETWCLWELLSVCHTGMKLAKGINVLWALPTGQRGGCSRNQAEIEKNREAQLGKPFPLHKFSQSPDNWLEWDPRSEFSSTPRPCCPLVPFLWRNGKAQELFYANLLEDASLPQELLEFTYMA